MKKTLPIIAIAVLLPCVCRASGNLADMSAVFYFFVDVLLGGLNILTFLTAPVYRTTFTKVLLWICFVSNLLWFSFDLYIFFNSPDYDAISIYMIMAFGIAAIADAGILYARRNRKRTA